MHVSLCLCGSVLEVMSRQVSAHLSGIQMPEEMPHKLDALVAAAFGIHKHKKWIHRLLLKEEWGPK